MAGEPNKDETARELAAPSEAGGYDYQFVETPSDMLVCKICQYPSREPHLSACCGHTFCKSCLEGAKKATIITDACPMCRSEEFFTIANKQVNRAVRSLRLFCTNKELGCGWQGEVNDIFNHLQNNSGCKFEKVTCSNKCGKSLQRQHLAAHVEDECCLRTIKCQYCYISGEYQFIEDEHTEKCPKFPLPCPNECEACKIPREDIDEHRKMCPLEEVMCSNGCGVILQRQHLIDHVQMHCPCRKVNCQHCLITGESQFIDGEHKEQCPKLPLPCPNKCEASNIPREDIDAHRKMCPLEEVTCSNECGIAVQRQCLPTHIATQCPCHEIECKYCHVADERQLIEGEHKEKCPKFPLSCPNQCNIDYIPRDQLEEHVKICPLELVQCEYHAVGCQVKLVRKDQDSHNKEKMADHLSFTKQQLHLTHQTHTKDYTALAAGCKKALVNMDAKFQAMINDIASDVQKKITELESKLQHQVEQMMLDPKIFWLNTINYKAASLSSGDRAAPVTIKMLDYAQKRKDKVDWYSDYFFTDHKGYKICVNIYAAGYLSCDTHLSVYLYNMKGPHDVQLRWPPRGRFEVTLLNQINCGEHYLGTGLFQFDGQKRVSDGERQLMWYSHQFITNEELHEITATHQYLKDDSIFLQVVYKQ
ncbi:TNF receptor-associated factor 2-like [Dysidea avara]|uniref:TNF receptor-associated factor 2-like n=1 Tax=Dysidea avara TaxID=196820 RepID=UPI0033340478